MARKSRRVASGPRFPAVVDAYLEDVQVGLQAADEMARHRALQRKLNPYHVAHLRQFFGERLLTAIDSPSVVKYAMQREASSAAPSVVNEELWDLGHLLRFAVQRGWLQQCPEIWFLSTPAAPPAMRVETGSLHVAVDRLAHLVKEATKQHVQAARNTGARSVPPARPPRRKVQLNDIADISSRFSGADGQPRRWWATQLSHERYGITYCLKRIEQQLKVLGIPPRPAT